MENISQPLSLNKLISLTFDESPEVRKQAAVSLGAMDDPGALFALMELSYDKDPSVRDVALNLLEKRKQSESEVMSFAELFSQKADQTPNSSPVTQATKDKVLQPITKIFERHLGKERAEAVRSKMMPTIEKIYMKNVQVGSVKIPTGNEVPISADASAEEGRKVMQEFLTSYLEVISDLDHVGGIPSQTKLTTVIESDIQRVEKPIPVPETHKPVEILDSNNREIALPSSSLVATEPEKELVDLDDYKFVTELKEEQGISKLPDTFFKKAYETMMFTDGDEEEMKKEMKHMIKEAEREITQAFKFAKRKFKEINLTNITKIKDGMRNIHTDILLVKSVNKVSYQKTKRESGTIVRLVAEDQNQNQGVIYAFENVPNLDVLREGLKIKVVGATAKSFDQFDETVMVIGKKGNIYIVL
jgi:hypothetical protein